ncbi:MAG: hypothetical protein Q6366_002075 [Candidatus Freyarchaeota archaeon]
MRIKTLDSAVKKTVIILALVSVSSFCVLLYFFFFSRMKLLVGLLYLFPGVLPYLLSLGPVTMGMLLSVEYTPLGLIWEGCLVVPTNPNLVLALDLLLRVPLTVLFLLLPLRLFTSLGRVNGYETLGEAVNEFKFRIWSTKEGKRTVTSMIIGNAIYYVLLLLILLSGFYVIRHDLGLMTVLLLLVGVAVLINSLFVMPRYRRMYQKLQVKQGGFKPKDN